MRNQSPITSKSIYTVKVLSYARSGTLTVCGLGSLLLQFPFSYHITIFPRKCEKIMAVIKFTSTFSLTGESQFGIMNAGHSHSLQIIKIEQYAKLPKSNKYFQKTKMLFNRSDGRSDNGMQYYILISHASIVQTYSTVLCVLYVYSFKQQHQTSVLMVTQPTLRTFIVQ